MINILKNIVAHKKKEIEILKEKYPITTLQKSVNYKKRTLSAIYALSKIGASGIIAEFKRKSPSKGLFHENADVVNIISSYENFGASMCSILTDSKFFGAEENDFHVVRKCSNLPLLRKDFIIDTYQIYETKAMGADVILLIAAILSPQKCKELAKTASSIGLEVLLEIHAEEELKHISSYVNMVGINNRNLRSFEVSLQKSIYLAEKIPSNFLKIAESGMKDYKDIVLLKKYGFQGFLIGEYFMKSDNPGFACKRIIEDLKNEN